MGRFLKIRSIRRGWSRRQAGREGDPVRRVRSRGDWESQLRLKSRLGPRLWYRGEAAV
jgi:hypothetical protein